MTAWSSLTFYFFTSPWCELPFFDNLFLASLIVPQLFAVSINMTIFLLTVKETAGRTIFIKGTWRIDLFLWKIRFSLSSQY